MNSSGPYSAVVENDTTEIKEGFEMCYDQSQAEPTGWAKFWKAVRELFVPTVQAACAQSGSIKGSLKIDEAKQTVSFIPNDQNQLSEMKVSVSDLDGVSISDNQIALTTTKQITITPTMAPDPIADGSTPWDGYKSHVGLKYVELCKDKDKGCKSSVNVTLQNLPTRDVRVKLKRKGKYWKDVKVDLYCSLGKEFGDGNDVYMGTKSKKLTKSKYKDKKEKSIYFENVNLSQCVTQKGRNYYLFVVVNYKGGKNASTENDGEEHVRIVVAPEPPKVETVTTTETVTVTPEFVEFVPEVVEPEPSISLPSDTTTCADCQSTGLGSKEFWDVTVDNNLLGGYQPNAEGSIIIYDNLMYLTIWNPEVSESTQIFDSLMYDYQLVDVCYSDFIQTSCAPFEFQNNGMIQAKFHLPYGTAYSTKDEIMDGIKVYFAGQAITPVTPQTTITTYYTDPASFDFYGTQFTNTVNNSVGEIYFINDASGGKTMMLSLFDVNELQTRGLQYPMRSNQTPFATCAVNYTTWQTPQTEQEVWNNPLCTELLQDGEPNFL